jgi:large subunit ribosomal protein L1
MSSKRIRSINEKLTPGKLYSPSEAFSVLKSMPPTKFDQSIEIAVNLGIDPRKSDQAVRGSIVLPNGTGRTIRVAVFTSQANHEAAKNAGADIVGLEDLAEKVKAGEINFDVVVASPDAMRVVGQLGQVLGPRGLMPNPKDGTVTVDVAGAVKNAKAGQVRYRTDKAGVIHCLLGKISFDPANLTKNLESLLGALKKVKPSTSKGIYFKKVTVSSTMGPGLQIDISSVENL